MEQEPRHLSEDEIEEMRKQETPPKVEMPSQEQVDELANERKTYVFTQRESVRIHRALGNMAVEEASNLKRFRKEGNDSEKIERQQKYIDELYALQDKVEQSGRS